MLTSSHVMISAQTRVLRMKRPARFGSFVVSERRSCVVTVELPDGTRGWSFTLDRGGPVSQMVHDVVAPRYAETFEGNPQPAWDACMASHHPVLASGVGLRALSLVDNAMYDALSRAQGLSVGQYLGVASVDAPLFGIVGYPPSTGPDDVALEVDAALKSGVVGVKLPIAQSDVDTRNRVLAAIDAAGGSPVALDLAWTARDAREAAALVEGLDLAWVEDPFVPGRIRELVRLRQMLDVPLASGDEESHLYHPEVLLDAEAVDIIRMDATCQGGVSRMVRLGERLGTYGVPVSWHMNTFIHRQLAGIGGVTTQSIEISAPGSGVDVLAEMLASESRQVLAKIPWRGVQGWGVSEPSLEEGDAREGWAVLGPLT